MTDPRIPPDRRVLHALQALTGMRIGEACGRRWRDYDGETPRLGAMHVWSQYDDQPLKTGRAVHEKERFVPVHPALARVLAEWRLSGFAELYGRPPNDDDFIVPDPATMGARTDNKAGKDHRGDVEALGVYRRGRLTHGLRRWFISACRNASARTEVVELMTHNAKGKVIDAYTSWEWSTLCDEISKLDVDLHSTKLEVLPLAKRETPEIAPVSEQVFASDFATRDQSEVIPSVYQWRRWESKTEDFDANRASTGNHRKPDPEPPESKHEEKHFRETDLPNGKIEAATAEGRADVGETPTADTLGSLARKVLSSSRHAESRELARVVLELLAHWTRAK
jgi:hypothetical protein